MARYFSEQDIDEFRDCFYLKTKSKGQITALNELKEIMRSLGMSPTLKELQQYFKEKNGKLSFADFLDVMHTHSKKEKVPQEIIDAFRASDSYRNGQILTRDLKHILGRWGEKLDHKEIDALFREANINGSYIKYEDFIRIITAPVPDY